MFNLDLIDPIDAWFGRILNGPMHRFSFSRHGGFSGAEVEMLLRQYGVRVWGREFDAPDELALLVKKRQAIWAEYILCRACVPLTCQLLDPRNEQYRQRHAPGSMPTPWTERGIRPHTMIDYIVDWLYRLIG